MKKIYVALLLLPLSGCVAVWGGSYDIKSQDEQGIKIQYDVNFTDLVKVEALAAAHCAEQGKNAALQSDKRSMWGISTASFACTAK